MYRGIGSAGRHTLRVQLEVGRREELPSDPITGLIEAAAGGRGCIGSHEMLRCGPHRSRPALGPAQAGRSHRLDLDILQRDEARWRGASSSRPGPESASLPSFPAGIGSNRHRDRVIARRLGDGAAGVGPAMPRKSGAGLRPAVSECRILAISSDPLAEAEVTGRCDRRPFSRYRLQPVAPVADLRYPLGICSDGRRPGRARLVASRCSRRARPGRRHGLPAPGQTPGQVRCGSRRTVSATPRGSWHRGRDGISRIGRIPRHRSVRRPATGRGRRHGGRVRGL